MSETVVTIALLLPLAVIITYYDVRYRRIPNAFVLATLAAGVAMWVAAEIAGSTLAGVAAGLFLAFSYTRWWCLLSWSSF